MNESQKRQEIINAALQQIVNYVSIDNPVSEFDCDMIRLILSSVYQEAQFELLEKQLDKISKK